MEKGETSVRVECLKEIGAILDQRPDLAETVLSVTRALTEVKYGEVIVKVQGGKPVWVDRMDRARVG